VTTERVAQRSVRHESVEEQLKPTLVQYLRAYSGLIFDVATVARESYQKLSSYDPPGELFGDAPVVPSKVLKKVIHIWRILDGGPFQKVPSCTM